MARSYNNNYRNKDIIPASNIRPKLDPSPGNALENIIISYPITPRYNITSPRGSQIYYNISKSN